MVNFLKNIFLQRKKLIPFSKVLILTFSLLFSCKEKSDTPILQEFHPEAIVLLSVGDVTNNGKPLKTSDRIKNLDTIRTGKKSLCDLQIIGIESETVIRMRSESSLKLTGKILRDSKEVSVITEVGGTLIHVNKLGKKEGFSNITPTAVIAVRGTKFEVDIQKNGTTKTTVLDGKIAIKLKLPEIENLSDDLIQKSETLKNIIGTLDEKEIVIESGFTTEINSEKIKSFLKETGFVDLITNLNPNNVSDIDKKFDPKVVKEKLSKLDNTFVQTLIQKAESKTLEEKLKECEELLIVEKEKLKDPNQIPDVIEQRIKLNEKLVMKRIEQIIGKESEIYKMKDGRRIIGVTASDDGTKLKVQTSNGVTEIMKNDVEEVETNE